MAKTIGRPPKFGENMLVVSTRFESEEYHKVQEIAALESLTTGRRITAQELIRDAVKFVYGDNERLRECFRRSRKSAARRYFNKSLEHNPAI